jgi:hypothetical protein
LGVTLTKFMFTQLNNYFNVPADDDYVDDDDLPPLTGMQCRDQLLSAVAQRAMAPPDVDEQETGRAYAVQLAAYESQVEAAVEAGMAKWEMEKTKASNKKKARARAQATADSTDDSSSEEEDGFV